MTGTIILLVVCGFVALIVLGLVFFVIALYNRFQRLQVLVDEAWSGIDVQLKKRFDLIPNLVETVKGYASQEQEVFTKVAELRSGMMTAESPAELGQMEGELRSTLKSLFAVAESYPELKSNQNFAQLQTSLQEIETELEGARRYYNGVVRDLNHEIVTFPANIVAGIMNLNKREFFEIADATERENVKVDFGGDESDQK